MKRMRVAWLVAFVVTAWAMACDGVRVDQALRLGGQQRLRRGKGAASVGVKSSGSASDGEAVGRLTVTGQGGVKTEVAGSGSAGVDGLLGGQAQGAVQADGHVQGTGSATGTVGVDTTGLHGKLQGEGKVTFDAHVDASGRLSGHLLDCKYTLSLCANANAQLKAGLTGVAGANGQVAIGIGEKIGGSAKGEASAKVQASISSQGQVEVTLLGSRNSAGGTIDGTAQASASANGQASAYYDFSKMKGTVGAEGYAQASASVSAAAQGNILLGRWLKAGGQVKVSYGAQAAVGGGLILSQDGCSFQYSGGAQLSALAGAQVKGTVQVNPCELASEAFDNGDQFLQEAVHSDVPEGHSCFWGPNCLGFAAFAAPGMDCCNNGCAKKEQVSADSDLYTCPAIKRAFMKMFSRKEGQTCNTGFDCEGFSLGPGFDCCDGTCQRKAEGLLGIYMCPNLAQELSGGRKVGESCTVGIECEGFDLGQGTECCEGVCAQKVQGLLGLYWCPKTTNLGIGDKCELGLQCKGNTLGGPGVDCCSGTCKQRVTDYAGLYWCPEVAVQPKAIGEACAFGIQCQGYTSKGQGTECCLFTCRSRKQGLFGMWGCF